MRETLYKEAFSIIEMLFVILIIGLISTALLRNMQSLQSQNKALHKFLLKQSSLFETQLFINKHLYLAKIDSIIISSNTLQYDAYNALFLPAKNANFMDISMKTTPQTIKLINSELYFNDELLLKGVETFLASTNKNAQDEIILSYRLCIKDTSKNNRCIDEHLLLDNIEIFYK